MSEFFNTGLTQQQFLQDYWQQRPLLIRQAFADFNSPLTPDELAGFACEAGIESRLIQQTGPTQWTVRQGPFDEQDFAALPEQDWTLLVQDMDKHLPELAAVLREFRFIPDWRLDDLMVSFAVKGGSVGPHTDGYDVFLLQAMGSRRWQIGDQPLVEPSLLEAVDLKILQQFEADHSWRLEPGDMLYLPPHFAHHGVALNDCMTFSIGFRSPTQVELLDALVNTLLEQQAGRLHFADAKRPLVRHPAALETTDLEQFKAFLHQTIEQQDAVLLQTLGCLLSENKPALDEFSEQMTGAVGETVSTLQQGFAEGLQLQRNPYLRLLWHSSNSELWLFIGGEACQLQINVLPCLQLLSEYTTVDAEQWQALASDVQAQSLLQLLINKGVFFWQ